MQQFYTVRSGDTLSNIASRWNIPLRSLIAANNLAAPYTIFPGQQLSLPPGVTTYVVRQGDSVYTISQRYGIPLSRVLDANGIEEPFIIHPGMVLIIPVGVIYYEVRSGDTLYRIAERYNVTVNGQPRPDLIIAENPGLTPAITPGMRLLIPFPPAGGPGWVAAVMTDGFGSFIELYEAATGQRNVIVVNEAGAMSKVSGHRSAQACFVSESGIISVIDTTGIRYHKSIRSISSICGLL